MNHVLKRLEGTKPEYNKLFKNTEDIEWSFEDKLLKLFEKEKWKTAYELSQKYNLTYTGQKGFYASLSNKILWVKDSKKIEEFDKANITLRTARFSPTWSLKESISFPAFEFTEVIKWNWEDSDLYNLLETQKFLFVVFKMTTKSETSFNKLSYEEKNKHLILEKVVLWNAPGNHIEKYAKETWETTIKKIKNGVDIWEVTTKKGIIYKNDLPWMKETQMIHVRPHAKNRNDTFLLPDWRPLTKQSFWFNNTYIKKELGM